MFAVRGWRRGGVYIETCIIVSFYDTRTCYEMKWDLRCRGSIDIVRH
jgi:hypothetical protein